MENNGEIEFAPDYFNSFTKTVINHRFKLENSFQEILYMIDVWINNGSGQNVESIESQYIHFSTYRPLTGSSYIDLPVELRIPRKGLINIKNRDQKCFLWCHLGILILQKNIQKELKKLTEKLLKNLIMMELGFPCKKKILTRFLHKKYQDHIPCSFAYDFVCTDDRFTKPTVVYRCENATYEFIKAISKE